jgi:hypothetical protein
MKNKFMKILFGLAMLFLGSRVYGNAIEHVVIDENGNGTWTYEVDGESVTDSFTGTFVTDPTDTMRSALVYITPFTFTVQGDYEIWTPGENGGTLAGVVRFYGNNTMIFYDNDVGPGGESLADGSGIPPGRFLPMVPLDQTLLGDPSETTVLPISGMAGYQTEITRYYTFLSVLPVPEPGVLSLLACSMALLALRRKPAVR